MDGGRQAAALSIVNTCAVSKRGRCSVQYTVLLLKSDMLADSDGTISSAVIRRVAAKLLNVAKCAHYGGQKQTKLTLFLRKLTVVMSCTMISLLKLIMM